METITEIWEDIPGYEGLYQVSNLGQVRRIRKDHRVAPYKIKDTWYCYGYKYVTLFDKNHQSKIFRVHRLVVKTFLGLEDDQEVNHKNFDKADNRLENLEVSNRKDNAHHAAINGRYRSGERNPSSKLTNEQAEEIRALRATGNYTLAQLAERYSVSGAAIGYIVRGKTYRNVEHILEGI